MTSNEEKVYRALINAGHHGITIYDIRMNCGMAESRVRSAVQRLQKKGLIGSGTGGRTNSGKNYALLDELCKYRADRAERGTIDKYKEHRNVANYKVDLENKIKGAKAVLARLLHAQRKAKTITSLMPLEISTARLLGYSVRSWDEHDKALKAERKADRAAKKAERAEKNNK
jgi:hypothetical protein